MAAWVLAKAADTVRREANTMAPGRSKAKDGTIGDAAHASRASRHNPNKANPPAVTAWDGTNDPANGFPVHQIMRWLVAEILRPLALAGYTQATAPEPYNTLAYLISADQQASWSTGWRWVDYHGADRHLGHGHWAFGVGPDSNPRQPYDSTRAWDLFRAILPQPPKPPDTGELMPADISQILAGMQALQAEVTALTATVKQQSNHGAFDYGDAGGDTNSLMLERDREHPATAMVVQRAFVNGEWVTPRVLLRGCEPGVFAGPLVRGRRLDFFAQLHDDGRVVCFTFDPENPPENPLPGGWGAVTLDSAV